ncbi:MAG: superoxide dismutase family protein, partial [Eubacteriales bacterium]|nr:superoxide dismutase family protein [Eubacteriales bacterium]
MDEKIQNILDTLTECGPEARAAIKGSSKYPAIKGTALFYPLWDGTLIFICVCGLPVPKDTCSDKICAFHIHEGSACSGTPQNL